MTLEIAETGIEMRVGQPQPGQGGAGPADGGAPPEASPPVQRESIVEACVRRVLAALRIDRAR